MKVLTFNTWGLRVAGIPIAKDVRERMKRIPFQILSYHPDIICLQEIWHHQDKKYFAEIFKKEGYNIFYGDKLNKWQYLMPLRGLIGNGLLVASRFPIVNHRKITFKHFTAPEEYFAGKGALSISIAAPDLPMIEIINTHLGALHFKNQNNDFKQRHIYKNLQQVSQLLNKVSKAEQDEIQIMMGDFNFTEHEWDPIPSTYTDRNSPALELVTKQHGWLDTFKVLNPNSGADGATSAATNPYRSTLKEPWARLDYIFLKERQANFRPKHSQVVLNQRLTQGPPALSDHYGVMTTFEW